MKKGQNRSKSCERNKEKEAKNLNWDFWAGAFVCRPAACIRTLQPICTCRMHAYISLLRNPSPETQQTKKQSRDSK